MRASEFIAESSTAGATSAGNVATVAAPLGSSDHTVAVIRRPGQEAGKKKKKTKETNGSE